VRHFKLPVIFKVGDWRNHYSENNFGLRKLTFWKTVWILVPSKIARRGNIFYIKGFSLVVINQLFAQTLYGF
jgi:hypothetical protein